MEDDLIQKAELEIVGFCMAQERYGFESRFVREVYPFKDFCPLPCTPAFVLGLVNVRGQLLSVLDLRTFFGLAAQKLDTHSRTLILRHEEMEIGILVDNLLEVSHLPRQRLQSAPPSVTGLRYEFLLGMTPDGVLVLDAENLLTSRHLIVHETVHEVAHEKAQKSVNEPVPENVHGAPVANF